MRIPFALALIIMLLLENPVYAAPRRTVLPKFTVNYTGSGSANFNETYTEPGSGECNVRTNTANEDVSSVFWDITWKNVDPLVSGSSPKTASFTSPNIRTDSSDCGGPPATTCTSTFGHFAGIPPRIDVQKLRKGYMVTVHAQALLDTSNETASACGQSSIFNNAITDGANGIDVTALKIKITPAEKRKTKSLPYALTQSFDCVDPAKQAAFLSTACAITTNFSGIVKITGKWNAKLVR